MATDLKISEFRTVHDMQGMEYIGGYTGSDNTKIKPWDLLEDYVRREELKDIIISESTIPKNHASPTTEYGEGTETNYGHVRLINSVSSTSVDDAATPASVKIAYDLASGALQRSGGTMTGVLVAQSNNLDDVSQVRNIYAQTTDLTAGSSPLANGCICLVYE